MSPGGPMPSEAQGGFKGAQSALLRPPGPWTCCGEGSGSCWPGGLGIPPKCQRHALRFRVFTLLGDQYWSPGEPALVPGPSWVLPTSWLQEAGKRPGSTFAIEFRALGFGAQGSCRREHMRAPGADDRGLACFTLSRGWRPVAL